MKIAFFVNALETERVAYATTWLAHAALRRGHEVWLVGCEDMSFDPDGSVSARATAPPGSRYKSPETFLRALQGEDAVRERIAVDDLDVLFLRNDPAPEQMERPWAQGAGILFGHAAAARGVLVVNDPRGLALALNKMYLQHFPEEVRPETLISRDPERLRAFVEARADRGAILKPLQGSGGESVFLVRKDDHPNLNQMIDAVRRFGYVIAQEYLPAAAERDVRLFLLNGRPLVVDGKYAAISRVGSDGDVRTNMTAGGTAERAELTERHLELAELVRPRLVRDGMFLVGLDIAGDRLMEINVFSPGGLSSASTLEDVDFATPVVEALEAKLEHRDRNEEVLANRELATL